MRIVLAALLASAPAIVIAQAPPVGRDSAGKPIDAAPVYCPDVSRCGSGGGGGGGDASAANQQTEITVAQGIRDRLGDVTSPATGSVNARLEQIRALLATPVLASGAATTGRQDTTNTALGAPGDTLYDDDTGSSSGNLVQLNKGQIKRLATAITRLSSILTALGSPFQAGGSIGNTGFQATGNVAAGTTDAGNPVEGGCYASQTAPIVVTVGQRQRVWCGFSGQLATGLVDLYSGTNVPVVPTGSDAISSSGRNGLSVFSHNGNWDPTGSTWNRSRGDTTGTWVVPGILPAGTDRSGTAGTTAATLAAANTSRRGLKIQNVSANNIGINEMGGTAAIGSAGTYTVPSMGSVSISTNRAVSVIASAAGSAYTATEY